MAAIRLALSLPDVSHGSRRICSYKTGVTLRAELHGNNLTVTADGHVAWSGSLGDEASSLQGSTGFRTDNARFELQYFAVRPANAQARPDAPDPEHCVTSEGD